MDNQPKPIGRVVVTKCWCNIFTMQVCAIEGATDEEILAVCNRENPAGTTGGWSEVIREPSEELTQPASSAPVPCADTSGRVHYLVQC